MNGLRPVLRSRGAVLLASLIMMFLLACSSPTGEEQKTIQRAQIHLRNKRYSKAIEEFQRVLETHPDHYEASLGLGKCYLAKKESDRAKEAFENCARLRPTAADPMLGLVEVALATQTTDRSAALAYCAEAIRREPGRPDARILLGSIYRLKKLRAEAAAAYQDAVRLNPKDPTARVLLAQAFIELGRTREAEEVLQQALRDGLPRPAAIRTVLSRIRELEGRLDEALSLVKDISGEDLSPATHHQRGNLYLLAARDRLVEPAEAESLREKALADGEVLLANDPANLFGLAIKGIALFDSGRYRDALPVFLQIRSFLDTHITTPADFGAEMRRRVAMLLLYLGRCYMETDLPRKASEEFAKAAIWDPSAIDAHFWSAIVQLLSDDRQGATTALERILAALESPDQARWAPQGRELFPLIEPPFIAMVERWIEEDPVPVSPFIALAHLHLRLGLPEDSLQWCQRAEERDPHRPETFYVRALALQELGRYPEMLEALRAAEAAGPEYSPPYLLLAAIYSRGRRPDLAIHEYQNALTYRKDAPVFLVGLAQAYVALGDDTRAIENLKRVLEEEPANLAALQLLTAIYLRRDRQADPVAGDEMITVCDRILKTAPGNEWALLVKGEALIRKGDLAAAEPILEVLSQAVPTSVPRWSAYASVLALGGKLERAEAVVAAAQRISGPTAELGIVQALCHVFRDEPQKAVEVLQAPYMLEEAPDLSRILAAQCQMAMGNRAAALRLLEAVSRYGQEERRFHEELFGPGNASDMEAARLVATLTFLAHRGWWTLVQREVEGLASRVPDQAMVLWWQAESARYLRQWGDAYRLFQELVVKAPYSGRGWEALATIEAASDPVKAIEYYRKAIPLFAGNVDRLSRIHFLVGTLLEAKGNNAEAIREYQLALEQRPTFGLAANNLAWLLLDQDPEQARRLAKAAVEAEPTMGAIRDTHGWICFRMGDLETALQELRVALTLEPYHPSIRYHTACAFQKAGDIDRARAELRMALAIGIDFPEKEQAGALLQELDLVAQK